MVRGSTAPSPSDRYSIGFSRELPPLTQKDRKIAMSRLCHLCTIQDIIRRRIYSIQTYRLERGWGKERPKIEKEVGIKGYQRTRKRAGVDPLRRSQPRPSSIKLLGDRLFALQDSHRSQLPFRSNQSDTRTPSVGELFDHIPPQPDFEEFNKENGNRHEHENPQGDDFRPKTVSESEKIPFRRFCLECLEGAFVVLIRYVAWMVSFVMRGSE
jgi:hypothetical protein